MTGLLCHTRMGFRSVSCITWGRLKYIGHFPLRTFKYFKNNLRQTVFYWFIIISKECLSASAERLRFFCDWGLYLDRESKSWFVTSLLINYDRWVFLCVRFQIRLHLCNRKWFNINAAVLVSWRHDSWCEGGGFGLKSPVLKS